MTTPESGRVRLSPEGSSYVAEHVPVLLKLLSLNASSISWHSLQMPEVLKSGNVQFPVVQVACTGEDEL